MDNGEKATRTILETNKKPEKIYKYRLFPDKKCDTKGQTKPDEENDTQRK